MVSERIHTTALRIDRELYQVLAEEASRNNRSVNQQVVFFIRQGLQTSINDSGMKSSLKVGLEKSREKDQAS